MSAPVASPAPDLRDILAPDSARIVGTLERLAGTARLLDAARRMSSGRLTLAWQGETAIDWNSQETVLHARQRVFVDEDGAHWTEDQLRLDGEPASPGGDAAPVTVTDLPDPAALRQALADLATLLDGTADPAVLVALARVRQLAGEGA